MRTTSSKCNIKLSTCKKQIINLKPCSQYRMFLLTSRWTLPIKQINSDFSLGQAWSNITCHRHRHLINLARASSTIVSQSNFCLILIPANHMSLCNRPTVFGGSRLNLFTLKWYIAQPKSSSTFLLCTNALRTVLATPTSSTSIEPSARNVIRTACSMEAVDAQDPYHKTASNPLLAPRLSNWTQMSTKLKALVWPN